tara:strand:+ start:523 stop:1296 length:774 start_codon:yes stop_codon:yes gene_type:complete
MRKITTLLFLFVVCFTVACSGGKKGGGKASFDVALTLADIEPKFQPAVDAFNIMNEVVVASGGEKLQSPFELDSDGDGKSDIGYVVIGDPAFDDFFKSAAKLNGLIYICTELTASATSQLKHFARSQASNEALRDQIKELVGDKPSSEWTTQESAAVMATAKERGQVKGDVLESFAGTGISMGVGVVALGKAIKEAKDLLPKGQTLLSNVKSVSPMKIGKATKGVKNSISNLKSVVDNTPKMLEEMAVLVTAFSKLN